MICPKCNNQIKDDAKFCNRCGKKIPRCPTCGKYLKKKTRFCTYDGTPIPEDIIELFSDEEENGIFFDNEDTLILTPQISENENNTYKNNKVEQNPNAQVRRRFCVKCGKPCSPNQILCQECQFQNEREVPAKSSRPTKKKKNVAKIILVVVNIALFITGAAIAGYFVLNHDFSGGQANISRSNESSLGKGIANRSETEVSTDVDETDITEKNTDTEESKETKETEQTKKETESVKSNSKKETKSSSKNSTTPSTAHEDKSVPETEQPLVTITYEHVYEVVVGDYSWLEAKVECENKGGYLATITSEEEYNKICQLASDSGLTYLWLGANLNSDSDTWSNNCWITGESWTFEKWYPGEPSREDEDGTKENYLCLWNVGYNGQNLGWTFNDQRNDIVKDFSFASGKIGYICERVVEVRK